MAIEQLYSLMEHRYDKDVNSFRRKGDAPYNETIDQASSLLNEMMNEYISDAIRNEITSRASKIYESNKKNFMELIQQYVTIPDFLKKEDFNVPRDAIGMWFKKLWAWNYVYLHQPEGLHINAKTLQANVCVYMADVLPELATYYTNIYKESTFSKKYNNPERKIKFPNCTKMYDAVEGKVINPEMFMRKLEISEPSESL